MTISPTLLPYLEDLEARIDPAQEEQLLQEWIDFSEGRLGEQDRSPKKWIHSPGEEDHSSTSRFFSPQRSHPCPAGIEWPTIRVNRALDDFDAMALQQFGGCSRLLESSSGLLLHARCNYGSSILPSLFGVEDFIMDDALDTLPTSRPLNDTEAVRRLVDRGVPNLNAGWGAKVFEMGRRYAEIARTYPKIGRYVFIYHPDLQGALDVCEVIWGSSIFYALYDELELVHALLTLVCETYERFLKAWAEIIPFRAGGNVHWGWYHRGQIMLRDDSAMNLSPAMFDEFVFPYDQRLLDAFGGGAIHFCGHGDHYITSMSQLRGLHAINLSQPEMNNMKKIFANTVEKGIRLVGLKRT